MSGIVNAKMSTMAFALIFGSTIALAAGRPSIPAPAAVPLKVFMSNVGSESDQAAGKAGSMTGGPGQAFNKFYAAVQSSGQYALVSSPALADLVFEMRYVEPQDEETDKKHNEYTIYHPQVRLVIRERKTLAVQGAFTELIRIENKQAERDRAFSAAIHALVGDASRQLGYPAAAPSVPSVADAPVPPQITAAKTMFISNAAGTSITGGTPSSERAYNELYAMMKNWGRYELLPGPAGADLILEISLSGFQASLAIVDPQTQVTLWGFSQTVGIAILKSGAQKNFDQQLTIIVEDMAKLAGQPLAGISVPKDVQDAPRPSQIGAAKTVFIANAGGESVSDSKATSAQAYNEFYVTMKSWGRYELVPTPAAADLIFAICLCGPRIQLAILDPKTQTVLWAITQSADIPFLSDVGQEELDDAVASLAKSTVTLAGQPTAKLSVPKIIGAAPVPSAIAASKKVFLARPTDDNNYYYGEAGNPTELEELYTQLYQGLKSWGQYELTPTPAEADLILQPSTFNNGVRLIIRDAKTRQLLWTCNQRTKIPFFASNTAKNYNASLQALLNDVRQLVAVRAQPSTAGAAKQ